MLSHKNDKTGAASCSVGLRKCDIGGERGTQQIVIPVGIKKREISVVHLPNSRRRPISAFYITSLATSVCSFATGIANISTVRLGFPIICLNGKTSMPLCLSPLALSLTLKATGGATEKATGGRVQRDCATIRKPL